MEFSSRSVYSARQFAHGNFIETFKRSEQLSRQRFQRVLDFWQLFHARKRSKKVCHHTHCWLLLPELLYMKKKTSNTIIVMLCTCQEFASMPFFSLRLLWLQKRFRRQTMNSFKLEKVYRKHFRAGGSWTFWQQKKTSDSTWHFCNLGETSFSITIEVYFWLQREAFNQWVRRCMKVFSM